ncbi:hypothetical protein G6F35_016221 [Rhizopus arrhizus]|nr:hypothetical protein G6F35_016221 [Rhizopus arrhizus]
MVLGTAGFTAALALLRMQDNRQTPDLGPLAVTGASGGVGALALSIFSRAGYSVHAISGKPDQADFLRAIGASEVLPRAALADTGPLQSARFGDRALWQRGQRRPGCQPDAGHDGDAVHPARCVASGRVFGKRTTRAARGSVGTPGQRVETAAPGPHLHRRGRP